MTTLAGAPARFAQFLEKNRYHPRSSAHGDELCRLLLDDLSDTCNSLASLAESKQLVHRLNFALNPGSPLSWNLDLVIGPSGALIPPRPVLPHGTPTEIWMAVDAKTIMTEHGKARRNRQRDLNSLHDIIHRQNPKTVVGGLVIVNVAKEFQSPLRAGVTTHRNIDRLVAETVQMMRDLPLAPPEGGAGLDAVGVIVIRHTNLGGQPTVLVEEAPAPPRGDKVHYETFLRDLCDALDARYYMQ